MTSRLATIVITCALATGPVMTGCSGSGSSSPTAPAATGAVHAFLDRYVEADGRVVRRDQGGDTVSEGQGYALLLAVAVGDARTFRRVWGWTQQHLQQPNGLFAYRWAGGKVADPTPAADADLQIAWALQLAGRRFHDDGYLAAAKRTAKAVADHEVGYDDSGAPVLAAGPWAVRPNQPTVAEPGYWTPPAQRALAGLSGDRRLRDLTGADADHLRAVTGDGARLPPDWLHVGGGQPVAPSGGPNGGAPVQSAADGQRTLVWTTCDPATRPLAARWWRLISGTASQAPLARQLDGRPAGTDRSPLSAVAAAATARAAGDERQSRALLKQAQRIDRQYPTYYGAAWVALGYVLLETDHLGGCPGT